MAPSESFDHGEGYDQKEGLAESTEGHKFSWYGSGETKVSANSEFALTYGVKTEVSLGISNELAISSKTEISVGSKLEAGVGTGMEFKKDFALELGKSKSSHLSQSNALTVGSDPANLARITTLTEAGWILIKLQVALLLTYSGIVLLAKLDNPDSKEELVLPGTHFPLGHLFSIITVITNLTAMLMILRGRYTDIDEVHKPSGVLTLDAAPAVFLGARSSLGTSSAGVSLNNAGIELSTASRDLVYKKAAGSASIVGFTQKPGAAGVSGTRINLGADGNLEAWGTNLTTTLTGKGTQKATAHVLQVTDAAGVDKPSFLRTDAEGTSVWASVDTGMMVNSGIGVNAVTGESFMGLSKSKASLGNMGSSVECAAASAKLAYGATAVTIDATGINLGGGSVTILAPGGPITSPDLVTLKAQAAQQAALQQALLTLVLAQMAKSLALSEAIETTNQTVISVRSAVDRSNKVLKQSIGKLD